MVIEPRAFRFRSSGLEMAGWEWGDPAAPSLVLLHGGRDLARSWDVVATALARDHHVIAPDLRGHGTSDWANDGAYEPADFVVDLASLLNERGIARFDLVGHSFGGNIAWRYAALYPDKVKRLVVIEGLGHSAARQAEVERRPLEDRLREQIERRSRVRRRRVYPDLATAARRLREANPHLGAALADSLARLGTVELEGGGFAFRHDPGLNALHDVDLSMAERRLLWEAITAPVLLVYGRESWARDPTSDGRASAFRNARTVVFDDAGHWVQHDRTAAFIDELRAFLMVAEGPAPAENKAVPRGMADG